MLPYRQDVIRGDELIDSAFVCVCVVRRALKAKVEKLGGDGSTALNSISSRRQPPHTFLLRFFGLMRFDELHKRHKHIATSIFIVAYVPAFGCISRRFILFYFLLLLCCFISFGSQVGLDTVAVAVASGFIHIPCARCSCVGIHQSIHRSQHRRTPSIERLATSTSRGGWRWYAVHDRGNISGWDWTTSKTTTPRPTPIGAVCHDWNALLLFATASHRTCAPLFMYIIRRFVNISTWISADYSPFGWNGEWRHCYVQRKLNSSPIFSFLFWFAVATRL